MSAITTLSLIDGVQIVVPNSLDHITPYVLQEQLDWFEEEVKFLRKLLRSGGRAIDIGANHGVYALCIAKIIGPTGRIWAFEPASSTSELLEKSIAANGFTQVELVRRALSSNSGSAQLSLNVNSELNALVHDLQSGNSSETVQV